MFSFHLGHLIQGETSIAKPKSAHNPHNVVPGSSRNCLDKIFKLRVTAIKSKVKSRSHHDDAHLQPLYINNVPTKCQVPIHYSFQDIAWTRFYRTSSLWQYQRSNKGQTITLHTSNLQPMSLPSINFLHLTVSEIQVGKTFLTA